MRFYDWTRLRKKRVYWLWLETWRATHRVDNVVRDVDGNVKETKTLAEVINHNVKATKDGTQRFLSIFMHALIFFPHCSLKQKRTK